MLSKGTPWTRTILRRTLLRLRIRLPGVLSRLAIHPTKSPLHSGRGFCVPQLPKERFFGGFAESEYMEFFTSPIPKVPFSVLSELHLPKNRSLGILVDWRMRSHSVKCTSMQLTQAQKIAAGILVVAAIGMGVYYFTTKPFALPPADQGSLVATSTNATSTVQGTSTSSVPSTPTTPSTQPDGPTLTSLIDIGSEAYGAKNFVKARDSWEQASKAYPQNYFSFAGLAELYAKYLVDYKKAEANYKMAITNSPPGSSAGMYQNLYDFYLYTTKADPITLENTLKEAIQKNPRAVEFSVLLARRYQASGRIAEAKAQFDVAIQAATTAKNTTLVAQLQTEKDSF